jgi:hypothetical protein
MCGTQQDTLCDILEISKRTLRKYYRRELDLGAAEANTRIIAKLFDVAMKGNIAGLIFWAKTRCGFNERNFVELSGPAGGAIDLAGKPNKPDFSKLTREERRELEAILLKMAPIMLPAPDQVTTDDGRGDT